MRQILFYNNVGEITQIVTSVSSPPEKYGQGSNLVVEVGEPVDPNTHWVVDAELTLRTGRPAPWAVFNPKTREWEDPRGVDEVYDEAEQLVRSFRDTVNSTRVTIIASGTTVDISGYGPVALQGRPEDQASLQGLAFGAQLRLGAGDRTTLLDFADRENVMHRLTPRQVLDLWQKGAAFVSTVYSRSWKIKNMNPTTTDPTDMTLWQ